MAPWELRCMNFHMKIRRRNGLHTLSKGFGRREGRRDLQPSIEENECRLRLRSYTLQNTLENPAYGFPMKNGGTKIQQELCLINITSSVTLAVRCFPSHARLSRTSSNASHKIDLTLG